MAEAVGPKARIRQRAPPGKKLAEKQAAMEAAVKGVLDDLTHDELATMEPREGLLRVMRWALKAGALPLFLEIATALMPYMHAKRAPGREAGTPNADEIGADRDPKMAE